MAFFLIYLFRFSLNGKMEKMRSSKIYLSRVHVFIESILLLLGYWSLICTRPRKILEVWLNEIPPWYFESTLWQQLHCNTSYSFHYNLAWIYLFLKNFVDMKYVSKYPKEPINLTYYPCTYQLYHYLTNSLEVILKKFFFDIRWTF